jgi:hypothetical protein
MFATRLARQIFPVALFFLPVHLSTAGTLREALSAKGVPLDPAKLKNLDRKITSGADLDDASQYVIAYYNDDGSGALRRPLFVDLFDRKTRAWTSAAISGDGFQVSLVGQEMRGGECLGSVLQIHASSESLFLDTHISPSAGCLLVLSRDLKLRAALSGWYLGHFDDDSVVHQVSEVHFAAVHPAEVALYNWKKKRHTPLFLPKTYSPILLTHIANLRAFYQAHKDWCMRNNSPCDPNRFDSSLSGRFAIDNRDHAVAFVISYELIQVFPGDVHPPSGPGEILYVYRWVDDESRMEFREIVLADARTRFRDASLPELLEPQTLARIFGDK